jgi:hypothetical protein
MAKKATLTKTFVKRKVATSLMAYIPVPKAIAKRGKIGTYAIKFGLSGDKSTDGNKTANIININI